MREQAKTEADMRIKETKVFTDSMVLLARAIAENPNPTVSERRSNNYNVIQEGDSTYFTL